MAWLAYGSLVGEDQRRAVELFLAGDRSKSLVSLTSPHPYALYQPAPGLFARGHRQHNALGFRGPELREGADLFRIFALGGSTTYSWRVDDPADAWPAQLEALLRERDARIEVVNAGLPMGTTAEALATLQYRVLPLEPRLVILHTGLNDSFPILMSGYRPDYSHDRTRWQYPDSLWQRIAFRSHLLTLLVLTAKPRGLLAASWVAPEHWDWESYAKTNVAEARDPSRYVGIRNNLRSMAAICREYGIPLILSAPPVESGRLAELPAFEIAYRTNVRILQEVAAAADHVYYVDTTRLPIPAADFADPFHLDAEGLRVKARAFADFLERSDLLPKGDAPRAATGRRP